MASVKKPWIGMSDVKEQDLEVVARPLIPNGTGGYIPQLPEGYAGVTNGQATLDPAYVEANRGSFASPDNAFMSDQDWATTQANKQGWAAANDAYNAAVAAGNMEEAERQLAIRNGYHEANEDIRMNKYGYAGGVDGSEYNPTMVYVGDGSGLMGVNNLDSDGNGGRGGSGGYGYDPYKSRYQARIDALTDAILNREAFAYDKEQDPLYHQYRDSYTRGGQRGMQDTLAQVSARTGGMASSYAETAAQQTYNNFMAELADKVPELQQLAYGRYMDNIAMDRADLQMLMGLDDTAYGRWSDDRNFDYGAYRDSVGDSQWAQQLAYQQAQDALAQQNWQTQFDYQKTQDELARQDALAKLQAAGNPGRTPYTPTIDEDVVDDGVDDGVIPASVLQAMQANYSDGNMPTDVWNEAVQLYGEEALTAAGFQQQQAAIREVSDYQFVVKNLDEKKRDGVSYKDLLYDLESARKDGLLTEAEYQNLKKRYAE